MSKSLIIALAGNPNSGKTTLFNTLTGGNPYLLSACRFSNGRGGLLNLDTYSPGGLGLPTLPDLQAGSDQGEEKKGKGRICLI